MTEPFEWGVHVLRPVGTSEVDLLLRAGFTRITVPVPWRWAEPRRGSWDLAPLDHFLAPFRDAGLPLQASLGPAMPHALPDHASADDPDFVDRAAAAAGRLAAGLPDITVFRVETDLNAAAWFERLVTRRRRGARWADAGFRSALLAAVCSAVRSARPDAELRATVHAGLPGWRGAVRRWAGAGVRLDRLGLTLQPCFFLPDPALAQRCGDAVREAADLVPAVEVARVAYPTRGARFSPREQRRFLEIGARAARDAGAVGFHWWALRDQAHDDPILGYWSPSQERSYGMLYYDGVGKPAADALRVLATGDRFGEGSRAG